MQIGDKIKRLRIEKQLTQEELADRCELSKGFISQLERDLTSPSIATLADILEVLGTTFTKFFQEVNEEKLVFKKEDMSEKSDNKFKYTIKWLVSNAQNNIMEPIIITLEPQGVYEEEEPHEGEEFGYVLSGSISLHVGKNQYKVRKGESFYFRPKENHTIKNIGNSKAKVIWISTPPSF